MVTGLNFMFTGCHRILVDTMWRSPVLTAAQRDVVLRLSRAAEAFLEGDTVVDVQLSRSEVPKLKLGYDGLEVAKAFPVSVDSVAPALPPRGVAGQVQVVDLVGDDMRRMLLDPGVVRKPESEVEYPLPKARVNVESQG
eukprot:2995776-Amphidinium_carterae.1